MDDLVLKTARNNKLSNWGEREPIVCEDREKIHRAMVIKTNPDLTPPEKSALYVHEISGCKGLEFVGFSNAKIDRPIRLATGIIIYPCFMKTTVGHSLEDPIVRASFRMSQTGRYIYDGWLPIDNIVDVDIRARIRTLREVLGCFPLISGSKFSWEPKYQVSKTTDDTHYFSENEIKTIEGFAEAIDLAIPDDRIALLRSIGWLSECVRIESPESKFLFAVLAIESLCSYIEDAETDSSFHALAQDRRSKIERRSEREDCIRQTLTKLLDGDPTKAISTAYFECIGGIKKKLQTHLMNIFGEEDDAIVAFFKKTDSGISLYELRHTIAHGSHDILAEFDRNGVDRNVHKVEKLAVRYIWYVLNHCLGFFNETSSIHAKISFDLNTGIISNRSMYQGPVDMGLLYVK